MTKVRLSCLLCVYVSVSLSPFLFPFPAATKQLQEVILRLIKGSLGDVMYSKAMNCVTVLRSEAINVSYHQL